MHAKKRTTCRVCGSSSLRTAVDLGEQHLQGSFSRAGELSAQRKLPMTLVRCNPMEDERACGLLQALYTVPPEIMYRTYWYRSGTNKTMRDHLQGLCKDAMAFYDEQRPAETELEDTLVLDIGCNDGTLMSFFREEGIKKEHVWGVDPSNIAASVGDEMIVNDFFPSPSCMQKLWAATRHPDAADDAENNGDFDVVTAVAMFYDLEDPIGFAQKVSDLLNPRGVFIFEMSYLPAMLAQNSYDTICHEHLEYYSLATIENIMGRVGMKVVDVSRNGINGGSIRCFAVKVENDRRPSDTVIKMRQHEFELKLDTDDPYNDFQKRADIHKKDLLQLLVRLRGEGKRIHVYGASTKGNTILQWCGIDGHMVDMAADRNHEKAGTMTPATNIRIVTEEESRRLKPDYYLVLPWHFREEFVEREHEMLKNGTRLIFPLPKIEIVGG